ncbi:hypothetical protein HNV12_00190 [Methanococcoides sp. SA1]|nr:hypothetical protein [Methanococcoides sp. SA1]
MAFNLVVPEISSKPKKAKDIILSILTYEFPLSIKQIHNRAKAHYSYSSSYQSIYKALGDLQEKKALIKKNSKYEIDIGWIKKVQSFTDIVETNYFAKQELSSLSGLKNSSSDQDLMILNFENIFDAEKYLYYFMKTELFKKKNLCLTYQTAHEWKPIFYLRAEYNYYTRLLNKNHKIFFLTKGNSKKEQEIKKFYKSLGIKFKTTKNAPLSDIISFSDYLIQIFIPESLKSKIKIQLEKNQLMELRKTLSENSSIKMIINKDKALAEETQKQILKKF